MTEDVRTALNTYATEVPFTSIPLVQREHVAPAVFEALRQVLAKADEYEEAANVWFKRGDLDKAYGLRVAAEGIRSAVSASLAPKED